MNAKQLEDVQAVVNAWIVSGTSPQYHNYMKDRLKREWPILANALETLAINSRWWER